MLKTSLNWSDCSYDSTDKILVAKIAEIPSKGKDNVVLKYYIEKNSDSNFKLYFSCNAEEYLLGEYKNLVQADLQASNHRQEFFAIKV